MLKKLFASISILNKEQKNKFFNIIFLVVIGSIFETLSLYLIYQTIKYFSNPQDYLASESLFLEFYNYQNLLKVDLIIFFLICLMITFIFKFLYFSFMYYNQLKFVNETNVNLSTKILENYLFQNFKFHLRADSSKLLRNIRDEVSQFCHGAILQTINLITESFIFVSIIILLSFFETKFLIFSSIFILSVSLIYYLFIKSTFKKWGEIRQKFASISLKNAMESLHGIKDIKIFNSENFFLKNYLQSMRMLGKANIIITTLNQIPRLLLETLIIIIVCFIIFYNFNKEFFNTSLLSSFGLFVAASFKLIPSIARILNSLNNIRYNTPAISVVKNELGLKKEDIQIKNEEFNFSKQIEINNVSFQYANRKKFLFENINLVVKKNTSIGLMGESGSGKSTLIDLLIGLQEPTSGKILVDGNDLNLFKFQWLDKIGYVPQKVYITNDTIKKNIALGLNENEIDLEKLNKVSELCQLKELISKFPKNFDTKLGDRGIEISGGELQRIGIARALYKRSEILVLDEFTSSLDRNNELKLIELAKQISKEKTVIISAHKKELLDFCDNIFYIKDNKINKIK